MGQCSWVEEADAAVGTIVDRYAGNDGFMDETLFLKTCPSQAAIRACVRIVEAQPPTERERVFARLVHSIRLLGSDGDPTDYLWPLARNCRCVGLALRRKIWCEVLEAATKHAGASHFASCISDLCSCAVREPGQAATELLAKAESAIGQFDCEHADHGTEFPRFLPQWCLVVTTALADPASLSRRWQSLTSLAELGGPGDKHAARVHTWRILEAAQET
jgi:hypothetical protein